MRIKVVGYNEHWDAHKCTSDDPMVSGLIDIMADGYFPDGINPEHLVGMEFDVEWTHPFISIAHDIK